MSLKSIMIVEDERIIALAAKTMLCRQGYEVCAVVPSGEMALEALKNCRPDLILMDIMLEGELDGIETSRVINQLYDIPIVYTTAYTDSDTRARADETRHVAFLAKPVDMMDLSRIIEHVG